MAPKEPRLRLATLFDLNTERTLTNWLRTVWSLVTGQKTSAPDTPAVIVHDPAADGPHDLDDPFFDSEVQARIGKVIAKATEEK